jgi:Ala-tRNA(Pro) deacylase
MTGRCCRCQRTLLEDSAMTANATLERPLPALLEWLAREGIDHEIHEHDPAFTARGAARAEGVDPRSFAKVVGVAADDGRRALVVLDATDHLDLRKARQVHGAGHVRLLTEAELAALAPRCEVGALPAVGRLFGVPTYADYAVRDDEQISFNAGSHRYSARVDQSGWERACQVVYADLAEDVDTRPAWIRS